MSLRPLAVDPDSDRIAELMREYGFPRATGDGMREQLTPKPIQTRRTAVAVLSGGRSVKKEATPNTSDVVGYADIHRQEGMPQGKYSLFLLVDPAHRRQGIGNRLYEDAIAFAAAHTLTELRVPAWDTDAESLAFAARRGFELEHVITTSRLDVTSFDDAPFVKTIEEVRASGIRLFPLSDLPDTPEHRRRLHDLYRETWLDAPDGAGWVERMTDEFIGPMFRPEAAAGLILAADPAAGGEWVGFTHLTHKDRRYANQGMTGVRRAYRGRKIAQALKVMAVQVARAWGVVEISTGNDSRNAPILAINRKLGFVPGRGQCSLVKRWP